MNDRLAVPSAASAPADAPIDRAGVNPLRDELIDAGLLDADHPVARRLLTAPLTNWRGLEVAELRTAAGFPA